MDKGVDYKITKLEKGPLQRFKNQNMLIKKFGDVGMMVYKAITGKRTSSELVSDLEMDNEIFLQVLAYMEEAGMVQLTPVGGKKEEPEKAQEEETAVPKRKPVAPVEEVSEENITEEEMPRRKQVKNEKEEEESETKVPEEEPEKEAEEKFEKPSEEFEITPIEEPSKEEKIEELELDEKEKKPAEEAEEPEKEEKAGEETEENEEITPIETEEATEETEEAKGESESSEEITPVEEEAGEGEKEGEEVSTEELTISEEQIAPAEEETEGLSPVEKIIREKYGDVGIKVYTLIDGQRTAEEIMKDTGLSESKLVEMLDFMDEEGIIKLEYPGEKKKEKTSAPEEEKHVESENFKPMVEEDDISEKEIFGKNPIETPIKAPLNVVEALYLRTKTLLRFGEKGGKVLESINGKNDVVGLAIDSSMALYDMIDLMGFLLEQKGIIMKPMTRADIRKKYGDEGYAIYKKYGKDGVFLYELVGKDMKIKDMVKLLYKDVSGNKEKLADMFLFIHQILKIDLPVDRELLYREFSTAV